MNAQLEMETSRHGEKGTVRKITAGGLLQGGSTGKKQRFAVVRCAVCR